MMARWVGALIVVFARLLTGVQARWRGAPPMALPTVYFANHTSHGDFVLLWASLPGDLRERTRPVAAADYWLRSGLRRFIGCAVFGALLIDRDPARDRAAAGPGPSSGPLEQMEAALHGGDSLILFPEGTRNVGDELLLPFKSGIYHLASRHPEVRLVPVWIENLRRVLPKGSWLPVPLACSVDFGAPLARVEGEDKVAFLARARQALLSLRPDGNRDE